MLNIKNIASVNSLEEAYELNQKKSNVVLGGFMWLKMGNRTIQTGIDLSKLGLDGIEETDEQFRIGCMCTLRDLEKHGGIEKEFHGAVREALHNIVGVQFRNGATVGGSIFGRYGFSDLLTCLMVLDSYVELFKGGTVPLKEFSEMKRDNDILVAIIIKKDGRIVSYKSQRNTRTDFPIIAVALAKKEDKMYVSVGARPMRARLIEKDGWGLEENSSQEEISKFAELAASKFSYGTNLRAGKEYRRHLASVYIKRAAEEILGGAVK
jgi:CO/xanthine dehydrogenase FAD-binding subunit